MIEILAFFLCDMNKYDNFKLCGPFKKSFEPNTILLVENTDHREGREVSEAIYPFETIEYVKKKSSYRIIDPTFRFLSEERLMLKELKGSCRLSSSFTLLKVTNECRDSQISISGYRRGYRFYLKCTISSGDAIPNKVINEILHYLMDRLNTNTVTLIKITDICSLDLEVYLNRAKFRYSFSDDTLLAEE